MSLWKPVASAWILFAVAFLLLTGEQDTQAGCPHDVGYATTYAAGYGVSGWQFSPYYQPGYSYYPAQWYAGQPWPAGYYYYAKPVVLTQFVPYVERQIYAYSTYQQPAVAGQIILSATAPVPILQATPQVPTGVITGAPGVAPAASAADQQCNARVDALLKRIAALEARATSPQDVPPPARAPERGLTVLKGRCASCHEASVATTLGGKFVMFHGDRLDPLTPDQCDACYKQIAAGTMPRDKTGKAVPLPQDEGQPVIEYLAQLKGGKK